MLTYLCARFADVLSPITRNMRRLLAGLVVFGCVFTSLTCLVAFGQTRISCRTHLNARRLCAPTTGLENVTDNSEIGGTPSDSTVEHDTLLATRY